MLNGICYCQLGAMSQCVARDYADETVCDYFSSSTGNVRCIHRNPNLDNHCWSPDAQAFSREHGVVRVEDVDLGELEEEIIIDEHSDLRRDCRTCILHPCHEVILTANAALHRGGLANNEYWDIGTSCPEWMDEEAMKATYNSSP